MTTTSTYSDFAYKYVRKPGVPAFLFYAHDNKLENVIWTAVPAVVLCMIIIILGLKIMEHDITG